MKKRVRVYGTSLVISFSREESSVYGFKEGSILNLGELVVEEPIDINRDEKEDNNNVRKSNDR